MKGYIQGKTIILLETLPENFKEGDEVDILITPRSTDNYPFPTFELGVKDEYISREKIYSNPI
jgi:ribosomal protein L21E